MAARKAPLRAVAPDEKPKPKVIKTLIEAAEGGNYRELLLAQKLDIARSLTNPETQGPARAALHRQLGLIAREIRELDEVDAQEAEENSGPTPDAAFDAEAL